MVRLKGWGYQPSIHEAEDAFYFGCGKGSPNCCSTGSGYIDYYSSSDAYINWTVSVPQAGNYTIYFRYALSSSSSSDRPLEIMVNDVVADPSLSFPNTGSWSNWVHTQPLSVSLVAGNNVIRAKATGSNGPNIDHLRIQREDAVDTGYTFRNAPHFMSMIRDRSPYGIGETTVRDAQYETSAVLDHYFYHGNTARK